MSSPKKTSSKSSLFILSIRSGSWKDRNPGRTVKRDRKRLAMQWLVMDYYTMGTEMFFESAISFFNEF